MRITKQIATHVASSLIEKRNIEITELTELLKEKVTEAYIEVLPKNVLLCHSTNPGYIKSTTSINLIRNGFNHNSFKLSRSLPFQEYTVKIKAKKAEEILSLNDKLNDKKAEYRKLKESLEAALFNLRTYANIHKQFPEAVKFLPAIQSTTVMINYQHLRQEVQL